MKPLKENRSFWEYSVTNWTIIFPLLLSALIGTVAYVEGGGEMSFMVWFMIVLFAICIVGPFINWYYKE